MNKRKITIAAIATAAVIMAGGGGVYAAYNYHQEQVEQEEQKRVEEQERLKQEEQKRLEEKEKKRLEDAREAIQKDIDDLKTQVIALYADDQKKMLIEGITQDSIDAASAKMEALKEKYQENPDISPEQGEQIRNIEDDLQFLCKMHEILTAYNAFYPNGQLVTPGTESKEALENLKGLIKELQGEKPDFCKIYEEKVNETENQFLFQESVIEAVNMIYSRETGAMIAGVTRQQYTDVLAAVESLPENTLKAELKQYLAVVDQALTAQEEAAKAAQVAQPEKKSNTNTGSNVSSSGNNSGSSKKGSSSSGNSGNNSAGTGGSSKGSSGSGSSSGGSSSGGNSGGTSSSGGSSGGSASSGSGSSGGSSSSGSGGGNNNSDGRDTWEGTVIGGGQTGDGGTVEVFEW